MSVKSSGRVLVSHGSSFFFDFRSFLQSLLIFANPSFDLMVWLTNSSDTPVQFLRVGRTVL